MINIVIGASATAFMNGCTTTNLPQPQQSAAAIADAEFLNANRIQSEIIGQTISGTAIFKSVGRVDFQLYFEPGTNIYRDRVVARNQVTTAFGSYRIGDDGTLCRLSKSRNAGAESCWKISIQDGQYHFHNAKKNRITQVQLTPGKRW